ncbi:MAG: hypothetical protein C4538_12070 [Nitrospiraceae bacterium]|nr:MAG: hypothetical protein C4538_12070 [Nitrospiraceae bacterium]
MKKAAVITILFTMIPALFLSAQENGKNGGAVTEKTNVHYTGKYCTECHEKPPIKGGDKLLNYNGDYTQLCKCHGYTPGTYIHPVDVVPSEEKHAKIPKEFTLVDGKVSCPTCHDMYLQCQRNDENKVLNKFFLRGAPYVSRTTLCFRCHDEKKYTRLDPHNQLTKTGIIIVEKCLYCHVEKPDEKKSTFKEVKLIGNLEALCGRCHFKQTQFHPINANHLRKPSEKILETLRETEKRLGVVLPLSQEGKITCPTCHNPHERGVIPGERDAAQGAGEKYRLRLGGQHLQICFACHKEKFDEYQK